MKKWSSLYESCRLPIRIVVFGFVLLALGTLILSENVNIFYTIDNTLIINLAHIFKEVGHVIIVNIPLIFLIGLVSKRANSGTPILLAIVGYFTFQVMMMLVTPNDLSANAYYSVLGISYTSSVQTIFPMQTGMVGSFIVAFLVRYAFLRSRRFSMYSLLGFANKDTAGLIYTIVFCALGGLLMSYVWPIAYEILEDVIIWIARDRSDPFHLFVYGLFDRVLSLLGMGEFIREPFWFGVEGGTYSTIASQTLVGDVAIWSQMPEALTTFSGAGRFITPYYVLNMFAIPAAYFALYRTTSNRKARHKTIIFYFGAMLMSFVCGNPLIFELVLLFTAPLLLVFHLLASASLFGILSLNNAFLGFNYSGSTISAMPGSFADFIINVRVSQFAHSLLVIVLVGIIFAIIYFLATRAYFEFLAYDMVSTNKAESLSRKMIEACGGERNIADTISTPFVLEIKLYDLELVSYDKIKSLAVKKVTETKDGLEFSMGSPSTIIRKRINNILSSERRPIHD